MKKMLITILVVLASLSTLAVAVDFPDVSSHPSCSYCGMDRQQFASSRMLIEYSDGSGSGLCSLRCGAVDLANQLDKMPVTIAVADYNTKELINAEKAHWVVGGNEKGVMSSRAKWAFADQADAEKFTAASGGEILAFEDAIKAAYEDMYMDTQMIRKKRQEMQKMKEMKEMK
jgi:nitrous oxide reductase accessory protein NosL